MKVGFIPKKFLYLDPNFDDFQNLTDDFLVQSSAGSRNVQTDRLNTDPQIMGHK